MVMYMPGLDRTAVKGVASARLLVRGSDRYKVVSQVRGLGCDFMAAHRSWNGM